MSEQLNKKARFQSEGRLLQELGERLVASPEVAIVELIKNAYDADATECIIFVDGKNKIVIGDDGHGISQDDFLCKWMRIATGSKVKDKFSPKFKRKMTGAKGIGRFAVRFLCQHLELRSTSQNAKGDKKELVARFDWTKFDKLENLNNAEIPYDVFPVSKESKTGTKLFLSSLRQNVGDLLNKEVRTEILKLIEPIKGLDSGWFDISKEGTKRDPGFRVDALKSSQEDLEYENIAGKILDNYWFRLIITFKEGELKYEIKSSENEKPFFSRSRKYESPIKNGLFADIRFFPRRAGMFSNKGFKGHDAWHWVRQNSGVGIIDHGFRIKPYGFKDDDWLWLSRDHATNRRHWRSEFMEKKFPMDPQIKKDPALNPMLYLPALHQLIGAVFVESEPEKKTDETSGLIQNMDREGFIYNKSFEDVVEIIRTGIELIALKDKENQEKIKEEELKLKKAKLREDIKETIEEIEASPTLKKSDKKRIVSDYADLAENIEEVEDYDRRARHGLEVMSLLGVVAGYMTHETQAILEELDKLIITLKNLSRKHPQIKQNLEVLEDSYQEFSGLVDYTATFIDATQKDFKSSFKTLPQVKRIIGKFGRFVRERNIQVKTEIKNDLITPPVSIALYSGVLLNLYSNAIKAVLAGPCENNQPIICFKGWNENNKHIIEVLDNGIGVPPSLRKRIWDPLFTTTSRLNNPLGSGMGLGLSLVKNLVNDAGGSVSLVNPPPGYSTCFKVELRKLDGK